MKQMVNRRSDLKAQCSVKVVQIIRLYALTCFFREAVVWGTFELEESETKGKTSDSRKLEVLIYSYKQGYKRQS